MSMQSFEAAARAPFAARLIFTLLRPEVLILVLLAALSLATALQYPELMAELALLS
ncbi:MAG TPA: hypothetical protein VN980_13185 [Alphaproteobacteria bacterium]|nr:hypothetical protein [Alphaproteobacteria bacterium]